MMSFASKVKAAVTTATAGSETNAGQRYRTVLDELATGLQELGIGARIEGSRDPRRLGLYLHAPYRPQSGSLMLSFFLAGDDLIVSGESPETMKSAEDLERWLLEFVKLPAFVESIRTLREAAERPVEARLRVATGVTYAQGDVVVAVDPVDQKTLFEAADGAEVPLDVTRVEFPGNAQFADTPEYKVLDSSGLVLNIESCARVGEKLRIKGRRAASA
jgi:hypothetical protein